MRTRYWKRLHSRKRECIDDQRVSPPHCKHPDSNHITLGDGNSGGEDDESALHLLASFDAERTNRNQYSCNFFLTEGLTGLAEAEGERSSDLRTAFVVADQSAFQADFNEGFEVEFQENVFAADRREEQLACEGPPPLYHSPSKKGATHDNNEITFPESLTIQDNSIPRSHSSESTATHTTGSSPLKLLAERIKDIESPRSKNETSRVGSWSKSGSKIYSTILTASRYLHLCSRSLSFTTKRSDPIDYQNMDDQQNLEIQMQQALSSHEAASIPTNEISSQPKQRKRTKKMSRRRTTKKHASNDILRLNSSQDIVAKSEESSNFKGIIGIPGKKFEDMPLWSAERFLRCQSQEKMMGNKEKGNMHCHEVEKIDALSTQTEEDSSPTNSKTIHKSTIWEEDWWEITITEVTDGEIKLDHESGDNATYDDDDDDDGQDNGSNISSHLPLCAMQSTRSSSSSQSSLYDPPDETVECINADVNVDSNTATTAAATVLSSSQTCEEENMAKRMRRASKGMKRTTNMNKSFRNVGLFTWDACRAEWRNNCKQMRKNEGNPGCSPSVVSQPPDEVLQPFDHSENNDNAESMTNDAPVAAITSGKNVSDSSVSNKIPRGISSGGKQSSLTSHQYKQVVKGLTGVTRQYELPKAMSLADIIAVYLDIWEGDSA